MKDLTKEPILKSIIFLAIPIFFGNLLQAAYNLIDTFWVGRLGVEAVAAVSLTFPIIFLIITFSGGIGLGGAVLVAQYKGAKNKKMVNQVIGQTFLLVFILSIFFSIIGYFLTGSIIKLLGAEEAVIPEAIKFMQISFIGLIFVFGYMVYQSLSRGIGDAKTPLYIVLFTVILNIFLDPLFIFGWKFIPAMGVSGAAIATIITQALALLIGLGIFFSSKYSIGLTKTNFKPDKKTTTKIIKLAIPTSLEQSSRSIGFIIITAIVASFGTITLAAYGIGMRLITLIIIPSISLAVVNSTMVGQNIGAKKTERAEKVVKISLWFGFITLTIIGIIFFILAPTLAGLFIDNPEVISKTTTFIKIFALSFGFIGILMTLYGAFRGSGNPKLAMIIAWIIMIFQITNTFVLSKYTSLGELGIWIASPLGNIVGAIIAIFIYLNYNWKDTKLIEEK